MIQISTTAPASWPGANTPLTGPARPVVAVTPVAAVGSVASARAEEDPARQRRPLAADGSAPGEGAVQTSASGGREGQETASALADVQARAEQRRAEQEAREAREQADREAIERLRQVLVDTWDASAAVVEQALTDKEPGAASHSARLASLYDDAAPGSAAAAAGQIIDRRV